MTKYSALKKTGLATSFVARNLFNTECNEPIPTISEYAELMGFSRGIIQNAIRTLVESSAVAIQKRGVKGSYLVAKNSELLYRYTGWDVIIGSMPIPLPYALQGLATAVCSIMSSHTLPFSFVFMSGSERRISSLNNGFCAFSLLSAAAAEHYAQIDPNIHIAVRLTGCQYCGGPFFLIIRNSDHIKDGMTALVDPASYDQFSLTKKLCSDKLIRYVECPFIGIPDAYLEGETDIAVTRVLPNASGALLDSTVIPIKNADLTDEAVLVTSNRNYGMDKLIARLIDCERIAKIQRGVIEDPSKVRFY